MLGIYVRTSGDDTEKSIEQQKNAGIAFATEKQLDFEVYEDEGISGFKIADDDDDIFKNRPGFSQLFNDVKNKKIDSVWVWENSRLCRNQLASAKIFHLFEKNNTKLYVKDSQYNLKDKNDKFLHGIFSLVAELERGLIIDRTTRGQHDKINRGERTFGKLFGYKKTGVDSKGYQILEKVDSEMECIKYGYKRMLEGGNLRQLTIELYNQKSFDKNEAMRLSRYWHKVLQHFSYTGYELNMEGLEVLRQFEDFETDSLSSINNEKYYTKSKNYTYQLVSIEDWIKVVEKLRVNTQKCLDNKIKRASKDMATGIITCGECGQKYYSHTHENKKLGKLYYYQYYKHFAAIARVMNCSQKKSFAVGKTDEIFKIFYFLNYAVYDNTIERHEETLRKLKQAQLEHEERIKNVENNIKQSERNMGKFQKAIDETDDTNVITTLAKRISIEEEKGKSLNIEMGNLKIELEKLKIKKSKTEYDNMYYNVKDKIRDFFNTDNIEAKRDMLVRSIKNCIFKGNHLFIETGNSLYIFDTNLKYMFDMKRLDDFLNDTDYKFYYTELLGGNYYKNRDNENIDCDLNDKVLDTYINVWNISDTIHADNLSTVTDNDYIDEYFNENKIEYDITKFDSVITFEDSEKYKKTKTESVTNYAEIPF